MSASQLFAGKVALVTGSTSGIGFASARKFAQGGARAVILNGRNPETGERKRAELAALAPDCDIRFIAADMNSPADIARLFSETRAQAGGLDIFVHSGYGGGAKPDLFANLSPDDTAQVITAVFTSLVRCCHHAVPLLREAGGGAVIGVASDAAKVPTPGEAVHGGALAANVMFLRTLAREVGRDGIRCNAVTPSLVKDTLNYDKVMADGFSRKIFEKLERRAQLGLPGPDDLAELIAFLASPLASKITGQVVSCNGGVSGA